MAAAAEALRPPQTPAGAPPFAMTALREHCDQLLVALRNERMSWWTHWREVADYLLPRRYKWLITANQGNRGSPINQKIINNTGTIALRTQSSGMLSGLTSPGKPWFRLTTGDAELDEDPDVKLWLDEVRERMQRVYAESNFYNAVAVMYSDLSAFGTSPIIIYEDFDDVIRCTTAAAGEYFCANGPRMNVTTLYREFVLTTKQVVAEFGKEACSETVRSAIATGGAMLTREIKIGHAIETNLDLLPGGAGVKGMPYREVYWELGTAQNLVLRVRGFPECPFACPRYDVVGNDPYGRSPGMDALGDIKSLQVMEKRKNQAIDKHVNPPMIGDISLKNEPASVIPGGVTYIPNAAGSVGFKPAYQIAPDFSGLSKEIERVEMRINTTFYKDLFLMISQLETVRSATEIDARREEKLIQLGPVIERFETEGLDPMIYRTYSIMLRGGLLPPMPAVMRGRTPRITYISMLAEAQRAASTAAIERLVAFVGNLTAVDPNAMDNIDTDEAIREYADLLGASPKVVRAALKVAKLRAQKAQAAQQQQQMAQTMAGVQGAQTLSQTDVGGGANALQMMLGRS